jgi:hypothetical protein
LCPPNRIKLNLGLEISEHRGAFASAVQSVAAGSAINQHAHHSRIALICFWVRS